MYQQVIPKRNEFPTLGDLVTSGIQVFDDSWDTYIPEYKQQLISKIIKHYFFYEIGTDTPEKFIFYINQQLAEIMPYYNQLYASELIKFDPMLNHAIKSTSRSIENLTRIANNQNNNISQAIKNFAETGMQNGRNSENKTGNRKYTIDKNGELVYNKHGTENEKSHNVENLKGHSVSDMDRDLTDTTTENTTETGNEIERQSGSDVKSGNVNTVSKDTTTPNLVETTEGTKNVEGTGTEESTSDTTGKTTTDGTTGKVSHLDENTTENERKDFSDTPQKALQTEKVRQDYLTNVTWNDTTSEHVADTTEDGTYHEVKDDTSKTVGSKNTTDNEGTTYKDTKTSTGNSVKDGTEDKTSTETTEYGKVVNTDTTKNINSTEEEKGHVDEVTTVDKTQDTTADGTVNKNWEEHGGEKTKENSVGVDDTVSQATGTTTMESSSNRRDDSTSSALSTGEEEEKKSTDVGKNDIATGYMNVSGSSLLEAFRKTFLNVDAMIVADLSENFLTVF